MYKSAAIVLPFFLVLALAQSSSETGELFGTVRDQTGGVLPGVTVSARAVETGLVRSTVTGDEGIYRLPLLPPGNFEIRAELEGFATKVLEGVHLSIGQFAEVPVTLEVAASQTEIVVQATAQLIERQKTVQSSNIESEQIQNLPINGRNYLDFTLLTPGSTSENSLVAFSAPQVPTSGLSFAGQDARSNSVTIDGADNNDIVSSGVRSTLSQEAIQEFQISRNTYSAEFGRARGGTINIVSKSGTNDFHGNAFFFFRNNALDATNTFSRLEDPPYERYEFGGTVGGPIVKDKTFFFASYERLDRNESNFVTFLDDPGIFQPTSSQFELFEFLGATPVPQLKALAALFINPNAGILYTLNTNFPKTVDLFQRESGVFPFAADQDVVSVKLDHAFSRDNNFFARANFSDSLNDGVEFGALQGVSNGLSFGIKDFALVLSDTHVFSPLTLNDAKFQFGKRTFQADTNDPVGPEIVISGVATFGREFFNPTRYEEYIYQLGDSLTLIRGGHTLRFGIDTNWMNLSGSAQVFMGGQFSFGEAIPLAAVMNSLIGPGTAEGLIVALSTPPEQGGLGRPDLVPNVLDPVTSVQSYNFGLPITYFQGFGNPNTVVDYTQMALYFQDNWVVRPNFSLNMGIRYDTDWQPPTRNVVQEGAPFAFEFESIKDRNNVSPRLGFAWDPTGSGRFVMRGGYGVYYQNFFQAIAFVSQVLSGQISQVFLPITGLPGLTATSAHVWGAYRQTGKLDESTLAMLGLTPGTTPSVILPGSSGTVNPYSQHASLGIEKQVGRDWAVSLDYLLNKGTKLIRSRDINVRQIGDNEFALPGLDPRFIQVNMIETSGNSIFHGFTGSVKKRFSQNYSFQGSYTLGKAIDDTTDFITQLQANNQRDLVSERGLSAFDQRHRLVISGIFKTPSTSASSGKVANAILADWTAAPIITVASGRPFNLMLGFDANGDTHEETDRPVINSGSIAGRHTGIGPAYSAVDLRLSRQFRLPREETYFEFIFEAFNLFNSVNYSGINSVLGTTQVTSSRVGGSENIPANQPLGFTSAFAPRQLQFGFRFFF